MIEWHETEAGITGTGPATGLIFTIGHGPDPETHYLNVMTAGSQPCCVGAYTRDAAVREADRIDCGDHDRVRFDANAPSGVVFAPEYGSARDAAMAYGGRLYF